MKVEIQTCDGGEVDGLTECLQRIAELDDSEDYRVTAGKWLAANADMDALAGVEPITAA